MMDVAPRGHETGLLERSVVFALDALGGVTPGTLGLPTPCRGWDLEMLLAHVDESMAALYEAVDTGSVRLAPGPGLVGMDVVAAFRARAHRLHGAWTAAGQEERVVTVGGCPLQARVVAGMGAIELAVHGWDIARATGRPRDIPAGLAVQLLPIAKVTVNGETRAGLFAPEAEAASASASDRLVAYLGREPGQAFTA